MHDIPLSAVQVHEFAGNLMFTLVLSVAITLSFEVPFMNLDKILFRRRPQGKKSRVECPL
jgi:hypothetical protein